MSMVEKIIQEIEQLPIADKQHLFRSISEKYFIHHQDTFVVGENYKFWLNDKDAAYDEL
jgi:hypothetical protein